MFDIMLADPPWKYNPRNNPATRFGSGVHGHYPTMTVDEIASLPVQGIMNASSTLFLWTTFPHLGNAMRVIEGWDFTYKTVGFVWIKTNPARARSDKRDLAQEIYARGLGGFLTWLSFFGTGFYTKSNPELCLLATRGKVIRPVSNKIANLVYGARGKHSAKPAMVNVMIMELFGHGYQYVELFSRRKVQDWTCVGDDVDGMDIRDSLKKLTEVMK